MKAVASGRFGSVYGVDFSGARMAGRTLWVARTEVRAGRPLRLAELFNLEEACGTAHREPVLRHLLDIVRRSDRALWAVDAPLGLPIEVMGRGMSWSGLLRFVRGWKRDGYELGTWCVKRALALGGPMHLHRVTDRASKTPFDCYHYRIIYQTFHAIRDLAWPLRRDAGTAILPFQYARLPAARRVLVETCPSSTLKRLGLPHFGYKQPGGAPVTVERRRVRNRILEGLAGHVRITPRDLRRILADPGGDALDAVIAAAGGSWALENSPHESIAADRRTCREGYVYA